MSDLSAGERWHDPALDMEFVVKDDINTRGMGVAEMDAIDVPVEYENGQTLRVPHERFRGCRSYEFIAEDDK